jgi:protein-L-isoaspartate(D-aspartate) O-methyltransferase
MVRDGEAGQAAKRRAMVEYDLRARGIRDEGVLQAMARVPRHAFVPLPWRYDAYGDHPLPIGDRQTISQPYIVALMTEALDVRAGARVLELGTGSGYQTAILAEMGAELWSIERSPALHEAARTTLASLGYNSVHLSCGDGTLGLPGEAPFDRILATGSLPCAPQVLLRQLVTGGLFVGPIGRLVEQALVRITYHPTQCTRKSYGPCRFVPLIGANGWATDDLVG